MQDPKRNKTTQKVHTYTLGPFHMLHVCVRNVLFCQKKKPQQVLKLWFSSFPFRIKHHSPPMHMLLQGCLLWPLPKKSMPRAVFKCNDSPNSQSLCGGPTVQVHSVCLAQSSGHLQGQIRLVGGRGTRTWRLVEMRSERWRTEQTMCGR